VQIFVLNNLAPGEHQVRWKAQDEMGRNLPSGIYFYVIKAGSKQKVGRMLLMR
jgi:hypothetical protein